MSGRGGRTALGELAYVGAPRLGSTLRRMWLGATHRHADVRFGRGVHFGPGFVLSAPAGATLIVGDGVEFRRGVRLELGPGSRLVIGAHTRFTYDAVVQCGSEIEIGERCVFAHAVTIVDGSHRFREPGPVLDQGYDYRPLRIGDDVAAMAKATVIAPVGDHAFIGAGAVVTRELPPYSLALGVPARVVERYEPASSSESIGSTAPSGPVEPASSQAARKSGASS